jgi:hypothetical protein
MATTTPNFGWAVPTSTDLVKDGAVAIETLGDSIDASLVDLKGGTTGQVLAKASGTDMDFSWVAIDPLVILDAKGDLITATAADTPARLAVGTNGQTLVADSTASTGLKWATPASGGGMTLISTTTLGAATTTITGLSTYKQLVMVFRNVYAVTNDYVYVQFNGDTGNNYSASISRLVGTTYSANAWGAGVGSGIACYVGSSSTATNKMNGVITVNAADQTSGVSYIANTGFADGAGNSMSWVNGRYFNTAVISSVTFGHNSGNISGGSVSIYGVN